MAASSDSEILPGFKARGESKIIAEGTVKTNDILVAVPLQHAETGVLQGDLKVSALVISRLAITSGTPVVRLPLAFFYSPIKKFAWCGAGTSPASDEVGWCMLEGDKQFDQLWRVTQGSGYVPAQIQRLMLFKDPRPTVEAKEVAIPGKFEQTWQFVRSKKDQIEIKVVSPRNSETIKLKRDATGVAILKVLDGEFSFRLGPDEKTALFAVVKPISIGHE